ncbi:MAG: hypothetical protein A4E69_00385 [Syntrophus sp. PtaB.Bin138]|nr:MAG: hypothetical protein A4E69_00385 [Syntrophus sp. PtaB.Bin138]
MGNVEVVEYRDEFRESSIELLKKAFPGSSDEATFAWRFDTSEQNRPIIVCAVDGEKVVSFNSWIIWKFKVNERVFIGYQSGESATDNNYRRMGIWGKVISLGEKLAEERGIDFFFGFPAAVSFGGFIKAGYHAVGTFDMMLHIIHPFLFRRANANQDVDYSFKHEHVSQNNLISPIEDSEYIDWRYHRNPKHYMIITHAEKQDNSTFVVRKNIYFNKRYKVSFPEIHLVDFCSNSFRGSFLNNSFRQLDAVFSRQAVWIKTFFNSKTERGKSLRRYFGIILRSKGPTLIFKKISRDLDDDIFLNFNNWDILPHVMDSY